MLDKVDCTLVLVLRVVCGWDRFSDNLVDELETSKFGLIILTPEDV